MPELDPFGREIPDAFLRPVRERAKAAVRLRNESEWAIEDTIREGRHLQVSWDRLGEWLGVPGETLRRKYANLPAKEGPAAAARRRAGLR